MQAQLAAIVAQFEAAQARLHRLVDPLPDARWAARADPARWSVAECVAHLDLTGQAYVPLLEAALAEGRASNRPPPPRYRRDLAGWLIGLAVGPLPRIGRVRIGRERTPPAFVPSGDLARSAVIGEFDRLQAKQIELTRAADGLPLEELLITSPFNGRFRYNVFACLTLLPRHQFRHLDQAEHVW